MPENFTIRIAREKDVSLILDFIKRLAEYEKLSHEVTATEDILKKSIFEKDSPVEVLLGYNGSNPVAFALFFHNFSTFIGKKGLYLEDLFVLPEERGKGFGKAMLVHLAKIAVERDCGRFEWSVLDWNEPAIKFYKNIGAVPMEDWTVYRLHGKALKNLSEQKI